MRGVTWRGAAAFTAIVLAAAAVFGSMVLPSPIVPSTWQDMKQLQAQLWTTLEEDVWAVRTPKGAVRNQKGEAGSRVWRSWGELVPTISNTNSINEVDKYMQFQGAP
jgi:hypothetical protein